MKFLLPAILLVLIGKSENAFAQKDKLLSITYVKDFRSKLDTSKVKSYKKEISKLNSLLAKYSKQVSYQLLVENDHSLFTINELKMGKSDYGLKEIAGSIGGTDGKFYVNKKDAIYLNEYHFLGEDFLTEIEVKKWKITDEFKFISDFKCYKAISEDIVTNIKGTFRFKVIAWFCPELPGFFGPAGYFGLPGLILELDNGKMTLRATKIHFSKSKKKNIKPLKKGIKLTRKEFDEFVKKKAKEMFPSYFKKKNK
ncbi:MAG: GLPGLI family protein [Flavobacteriaceae bacterium]|nr:MAG: GLPGLI family protein [Flavobacteriaceae bacterium]QMU65187.1 MAG: GLPGLI family protein [Flavobacteriaceae bacterium]